MSDFLIPVVLCGGSGTRLWPLSRETYPKQFLAVRGGDSLLQETVKRMQGVSADVPVAGAPILVCNADHRFLAAGQLQQVGIDGARIVLEPVGRNTAPALTLGALQAVAEFEDPVLLAMPADHVIADINAFHVAVKQAFDYALSGGVVTFGIIPSAPETGYGYIKVATNLMKSEVDVLDVVDFVEKPDLETAKCYVDAGSYYWNSGLFMVRASVWLRAVKSLCPDIWAACSSAMSSANRDVDFIRPEKDCFNACPSDSIDYAVMERLVRHSDLGIGVSVVPMHAGWSDVGAWNAVWDVSSKDANGNAIRGDVLLHECENSLFFAGGRLVAGVGLHDLVIVETPDAILVADKSRAQDVKHIVSDLREAGYSLANIHRKMHRPWGWYDAIDGGDRFQVKRIVVSPGASLSLQMHHHRAEHWVVVKGTAQVTNGDETFLLGENESTYIPLGHVHRLANPGKVPLEIIEVQSGSYLGEDDIVRFEDTYGRAPVATTESN